MSFHFNRHFRHGTSACQRRHTGIRNSRVEQRQRSALVIEQQIPILIDFVTEQAENLRFLLQMRHVEREKPSPFRTDSVKIEFGDFHNIHSPDGGIHSFRGRNPQCSRIAVRSIAAAVEHQSRRSIVDDERTFPSVQERRRGQQVAEPANRYVEPTGRRPHKSVFLLR